MALQQQQPPSYPPPPPQFSCSPTPPARVFCGTPNHGICNCPIVVEYRRQGRITCNKYGKITLPDRRLHSHSRPGQNIQEQIDCFWRSQDVRGNDDQSHGPASMYFLEVQNECAPTMDASTLDNYHHDSATPTASPEVQDRIRFLQAQVKLLRRSSKRVIPTLQHRITSHRVSFPCPQLPPPTHYSSPARSVDPASTPQPQYSIRQIPMPPPPPDKPECRFAVNDTESPTSKTAEEAVDIPSQFPEPHRQHTQPRSGPEEPVTVESLVESSPISHHPSHDTLDTSTTFSSSSGPHPCSDSLSELSSSSSAFAPSLSQVFAYSQTTFHSFLLCSSSRFEFTSAYSYSTKTSDFCRITFNFLAVVSKFVTITFGFFRDTSKLFFNFLYFISFVFEFHFIFFER